MKATDLMIGDWVSDKYGYLMQITFIGNGYVSFEDDIPDIVAISLVKEVIEQGKISNYGKSYCFRVYKK